MSVVCVDGNPQACAMTVIPVSVSLGVSAGSGDLIIPCSGCRGVCVYGTQCDYQCERRADPRHGSPGSGSATVPREPTERVPDETIL